MEKQNKSVLYLLKTGFLITLLTTYFLSLFNQKEFIIPIINIEFPYYIEYLGEMALFMINMYFVFSICLQIFDKRIYRLLIYYIPFYIIPGFLDEKYFLVQSTLMPFIYCIIIAVFYKINLKKATKDILKLFFTIMIYQSISLTIRFGSIITTFETNVITGFIYQIDLLLVYYIFLKEVREYGKYPVFSKFKSNRSVEKTSKNDLVKDLTKKQKYVFRILATTFQIFQLSVVLLIGYFNNTSYELLIMLITFWIGKSIFKNMWHGDTLTKCNIATFTSFYILTKITIPLQYSLFACTILATVFVFILNKIGLYTTEHDYLKSYHDKIEKFNLKNCTHKQLTERCKFCGMSDEDIKVCIMLFIEKVTLKEASDTLGIEYQSAKNRKYILSKRLKKIN